MSTLKAAEMFRRLDPTLDDTLARAQSFARVVDAVEAVTVFGCLDCNAEHHHGIDIADPELLRKGNLRKGFLFTVPVEYQSTGDCLLGKNAEIDAVVLDECGAERQYTADPVLKPLVFISGKCVDQFHFFPPVPKRVSGQIILLKNPRSGPEAAQAAV